MTSHEETKGHRDERAGTPERGPELTLADLPAGLLERVVAALRRAEQAAIAVIATGSYAAGRAAPQSDLDLTVLTAIPPVGHYRTWFEPRGPLWGSPLPLHVSAGAQSLSRWVEEAAEPADWSLGFPTEEVARFVWTTDAARAVLGDPPTMRRPPASVELEDFLEGATKVQRAAAAGDHLGARWHAQGLAGYTPRLLRPLNPERRVTDIRDALRAALDLGVAPPHYREDLQVCLGLRPTDDRGVVAAARRLALDTLALLRERMPDVDRQPDLARYLADGTLERHLREQ
jgi:phosphoribosyl-AMP cyclohydrolase